MSDNGELYYKMDAVPKGYCVIINNREFVQDESTRRSVHLDRREGTDIDRDGLKSIFERLDFLVECHDDLSHTDMADVLREMGTRNHSRYDCFVACILSHGCVGHVYGSNGVAITLRELTSLVNPTLCRSLTGKPKLFFIQACQGRAKQLGSLALESDVTQMPEVVPNEADYLLSFSTVPGFRSFRDPARGSVFVSKLTRCLEDHSGSKDILEILTLVNHAVGQEDNLLQDGVTYKQSPAPLYSLRKKVRLGPPNPISMSPQAFGLTMQGDVESDTSKPSNQDDVAQGCSGQKMFRMLSYDDASMRHPREVEYTMTVTTGDLPEAETNGTVWITIFGVGGTTPPIQLPKGFLGCQRGSHDSVKLILEIAPIKKIRVTVEPNFGEADSWYLQKVELVNESTQYETSFHHDGWLRTRRGQTAWADIPATECGKKLLEETCSYRITVKTSSVAGAGTDANVFVVLFGVNGDSGELHLEKSENYRDPFERGRLDVFTFHNMLSLGELYKLRVWHDNTKFAAAWHLSSIEVKDLSSGKVYTFCCDRWLSATDDDGQTLRELAFQQPTGPPGNVVYEIEVKTLREEGSGTVHNVWLILEGSTAKSEVFKLSNSDQYRIFKQGQTNFFTLTSPCLGNVEACTIGAYRRENCSIRRTEGSQSTWRCLEVFVTDTGSGTRTFFPFKSVIRVTPSIKVEDGTVCQAQWGQDTHWARVRTLSPTLYEVTVRTGDEDNAGTNANVCITILGTNGDTGKRPLKKSLKDLFERGHSDQFQLEALDLGELVSIRMEHDNSGAAPAWLLDSVEITNTRTQIVTFFHCDQWLDKDTGTSRDFKPTSPR